MMAREAAATRSLYRRYTRERETRCMYFFFCFNWWLWVALRYSLGILITQSLVRARVRSISIFLMEDEISRGDDEFSRVYFNQ